MGFRENETIDENQILGDINDMYNKIKNDLPEPIKIDNSELQKLKESNRDNCIICLEDFEIDNAILSLPCSHIYHKNCILRWFLRNKKCPTCKADFRKDKNEQDINPYNNLTFNNNQNYLNFYELESNNVNLNSIYDIDNNLNNNIIN